MFIIGHTALAYLLTQPFLYLGKAKIKTSNTLFLFVFANLIDVLNFPVLRYYGHSLMGTFLFSIFWFYVFYKHKLIEKKFFPLIFIVLCSHVIADYLFSNYNFFAPFISTQFSIYGDNIRIGLKVEIALTILFGIFFILSKDYQKMKAFFYTEKVKFLKKSVLNGLFSSEHVYFYLFIFLYLFSIGQLIFFITRDIDFLMENIKTDWVFVFVFIAFIIVFTDILFGNPKNTKMK